MLKRTVINILYPPLPGHRISAGLLVVRLLFGLGLLLHGLQKLSPEFDPTQLAAMVGLPAFFGYIAVFAEIAGGAAILLGALTPPMAALGGGTMLGAIKVHVSQGDPFIGSSGGAWELAALYLAVCVLLVLTGPGRYSLDAVLLQRFMRR